MRANSGGVVWLTGLSGSGKSTLASELVNRLSSSGYPASPLDGDELRSGLCSDLGFSRAERRENVRRAAEVGALMAKAGLVCVVALISPYATDRASARTIVSLRGVPFLEVFVDAPLAICELRDPKGLYRRARSGTVHRFTGISDPYETPCVPDVHVRTDLNDLRECAAVVLSRLWPKLQLESNSADEAAHLQSYGHPTGAERRGGSEST
jgi:bifunctional enzyme CysN/CysC